MRLTDLLNETEKASKFKYPARAAAVTKFLNVSEDSLQDTSSKDMPAYALKKKLSSDYIVLTDNEAHKWAFTQAKEWASSRENIAGKIDIVGDYEKSYKNLLDSYVHIFIDSPVSTAADEKEVAEIIKKCVKIDKDNDRGHYFTIDYNKVVDELFKRNGRAGYIYTHCDFEYADETKVSVEYEGKKYNFCIFYEKD